MKEHLPKPPQKPRDPAGCLTPVIDNVFLPATTRLLERSNRSWWDWYLRAGYDLQSAILCVMVVNVAERSGAGVIHALLVAFASLTVRRYVAVGAHRLDELNPDS